MCVCVCVCVCVRMTSSFNLFKEEAQTALFKDPVRSVQQTLFFLVIKPISLCYMGRNRCLFWDKYKTLKVLA